MAHLERERMHFAQAADTYALVAELAERIGQVEVQVGAVAGLGICRFLMGDMVAARSAAREAAPILERMKEWFQGRELVEGLDIHLLLADGNGDTAATRLTAALASAAPSDAYGAAWLTAEFGDRFSSHPSDAVRSAIRENARRPEVLGNPRMRERLQALNAQ
jgi:hypothetical protein